MQVPKPAILSRVRDDAYHSFVAPTQVNKNGRSWRADVPFRANPLSDMPWI